MGKCEGWKRKLLSRALAFDRDFSCSRYSSCPFTTRIGLQCDGQNELGTPMPKLFSYGTLQQEDVQLATFGRRLTGVSDALVGYRQSMVAIQDPEVVRTSGKTHHPIVAFTGKNEDRVAGALFESSEPELSPADP